MTTAQSDSVAEPAAWWDAGIDDLTGVPPRQAAVRLGADAEHGLTQAEASARLARAGRNEPVQPSRPRWPRILLRQFAGKLLLLLIVATGVSLLLGEWLNAGAIGVTVLISALFGFLNEYRSERAIAALHDLTARRAEVVRDGQREEILAAELVPGDLIVLDDGDIISADARVVTAHGLLVNESVLTGEPEAVAKAALVGDEAAATPATALFAGTTVVAGSGAALVVATGARTRLGSIAAAMQRTGRQMTPLERRLAGLGDRLIYAFLIACALLVVLGLIQGRPPTLVVQIAVALAIGAVPEGLPAVATTTLAIAVRRLARRGVLVRQLDAVEALGSTTVIVTDKTGTLTENRMTLRRVILADGRGFTISDGDGSPGRLHAEILTESNGPPAPEDAVAVQHVLRIAALCNDAVVEWDEEHGWHVHGDPTEGAIAMAAAGLGLDGQTLHETYPRLATEPFTTATRMMRTTHGTPNGGSLTAVKGAYERVAALDTSRHPLLEQAAHTLGDDGFRVLAVAAGRNGGAVRVLGAVVLEDPLRRDAAAAVAACRAAGVRLILATGDQLATARTIGRQTGLLDGGRAVLASDLEDLTRLDGVAVVARASHGQKEALVKALQSRGEIVAMTGDGVNDATAMIAADVGVAVGPGATDVAVEAADIVLTDGRLMSLVGGIREGRQIAFSLREAIMYLLTASLSMIAFFALSMALSRPPALSPIQILWLNIVVHIFPALALAITSEPSPAAGRPTAALLPNDTWFEVVWRALSVALTGVAALLLDERFGSGTGNPQTIAFMTMAAALVGQVFLVGVRSPRQQPARLLRAALWGAVVVSAIVTLLSIYLPGLQDAIDLQPPSVRDWLIVLGCVFVGWNVNQAGAALIGRWTGREAG
jgi:Ca2+-transporting ATPase